MIRLSLVVLAVFLLGASTPQQRLATFLDKKIPHAWHAPKEDPEAYSARMLVISKAVLAQRFTWNRSTKDLHAMVLAVWINETNLAVDVHQGLPGKFGSDGGRAKCLGQIHQNGRMTRAEWVSLAGIDLEATTRCAAETAFQLVEKADICKTDDPGELFDAYGTGNCKQRLKRANREKRIATFYKLRTAL